MDCYPHTDCGELKETILTVGYKEIADNYIRAVTEGKNDDWIETDRAYYSFFPSLSEYLEEYVENHKDVIFD